MGYCVSCEGEIELKNGISEERIAEIENILCDIYENVVFHNNVGINDGILYSVFHDNKYYEDETLEALRRIANDVEEAKIDYEGEDGQEWAFTIENGNIYELTGLDRAYKDSTLIYGEEKAKEPNTVTISYAVETSLLQVVDYALSNSKLDLKEIIIDELWGDKNSFIDSLMDNVLFAEPFLIKYECEDEDYDDVRDELKNKIYDILSKISFSDWENIISISDENYLNRNYDDINAHDDRVRIWTLVDIDMEEFYKSIIYKLTNYEIRDVSVKDISWINGEFKVETTEGEKFTIHKDGSVTVDDEMKSVAKEDKPKNKGYER